LPTLKAGTQVFGGVNARKAGTTVKHADKDGNDVELPVFASVAEAIKETGTDVSTAIGIGGDPVIGATHIDAIEAFEKDPETTLIVTIGEIGGDAEEKAAAYIKANVSKSVVC
jgi:succinyl-CoA synthetase alpha subunit